MARKVDRTKKVNIAKLMELVESRSDWKAALERRQHKFVSSCLEQKWSVSKVAAQFEYAISDMESILGRIQSKLESDAEKQLLMEQLDVHSEATEKKKENPRADSMGIEQQKKLKRVLLEAKKVDVEAALPKRLAESLRMVMEVGDINEAAKRMDIGRNYLLERIIGRKSPRKPSEQGVLHYFKNHSSAS